MGSNSEGPFAGYSSCHFIPRFQPAIPQVVDRLRPRRQSRASVPQQRSNTKGRKSKNDRTFQYEPLDPAKREIRLFELWPGKPGSKVFGHLFNVSLDESPSFEALSYTWGPPQPTYNISINGHRAFPVRRNLRKALDDLRQPDKPRVLWRDAIYINQPNNTEKAHQIKLMRSIYSCAQVVCAWLDHSVQPMDAKTLHVSVRKSSLMTMIRPTGIQLPMFFEIRTGKGCGPSRSSSWPKKSTYITSGMSLMGSSKRPTQETTVALLRAIRVAAEQVGQDTLTLWDLASRPRSDFLTKYQFMCKPLFIELEKSVFVETECRRLGSLDRVFKVEPGDQVWVLHGCQMPMVLRPVPGKKARFTVIGPAIFPGLMRGAALSNGEAELESTVVELE
ncbi:heterokaryon incompatibility protein-domain-containing protein [Aspergillus pseudocaelatus]|uniref:Heterokaryon incompatibility protein-domain-containing protein n=1 Tax=Aspergillus pseudocaelatus TaxID=1825620 RepID=A0ABQ6WM86_9EURO|nr:heterokaryon incompatibility protein-domain-containing protein [Aspergillus pseudocaelatus]